MADKKVAYDNEVPAGKPLPWGPPGTPRPGQPKVAIRDDQDLDDVTKRGYQSLG